MIAELLELEYGNSLTASNSMAYFYINHQPEIGNQPCQVKNNPGHFSSLFPSLSGLVNLWLGGER
jgi:hypothetical protein